MPTTQTLSGYVSDGAASAGSSPSASSKDDKGYWSHSRLKRAYIDYLGSKREEIDEQQDSRRFVHGSHWTNSELTQLNARKQPATWENITATKIRGVVGTLERLKQDPKAYPRTPKHEQGAELATAALRYALDVEDWPAIDPICSEMAAIDGIGGLEFGLTEGDHGDREISLDAVYMESFFYDPRSHMPDFSDARYLGVGKWMDFDAAVELYPDEEDKLESALTGGEDLSSNSDRDKRWFQADGDNKQLRLVEIWYRLSGEWNWCVFTGAGKLKEGKSPFKDEKGKSDHKYEMFCAYVDQDGDRYGLVRNLKPLNRAINMCKSKAMFLSLSRRLITPKGAFDDVEVARREAARADGVVEYNNQGDLKPEFDDTHAQNTIAAMFKFYETDRLALDSFGPNISLLGQGLEDASGRAIQLRQQAGLADLGPFIQSYRGWKIRVYRKLWNAIQQHWTGERWIRVTDDDDISQFVQVNGTKNIDPSTGQEMPAEMGGVPTMVNMLGSLDVDIIIDEGPDSVTQLTNSYETLELMVKGGAQLPPEVLIELNPNISLAQKKKVMEMLHPSQPDPEVEKRKQIETQMGIESVKEKAASAQLKQAQAAKTAAEAQVVQPEQGAPQQPGDHPMKIQSEAMDKQASAAQKMADAEKKRAETQKVYQDIQLEPQRLAIEQADKERDRQIQMQESAANRQQAATDSDRNYQVNKMKAKQKPSPSRGK